MLINIENKLRFNVYHKSTNKNYHIHFINPLYIYLNKVWGLIWHMLYKENRKKNTYKWTEKKYITKILISSTNAFWQII